MLIKLLKVIKLLMLVIILEALISDGKFQYLC